MWIIVIRFIWIIVKIHLYYLYFNSDYGFWKLQIGNDNIIEKKYTYVLINNSLNVVFSLICFIELVPLINLRHEERK